MKGLKKILAAICIATIPVLHSCNDEEGYSIGDFTQPSWATISTTGDSFYLNDDTWGTLWPINQDLNSNVTGYQPNDGQRVIISFNPIADNYYGYDHAIKILSMQEVLTKEIEILTSENEKEYGNDPILISKENLTISGNHLNIIYQQNRPSQNKHRICLVRPSSDKKLLDEDGYIHLELRYNTFNDVTGFRVSNAVSFYLGSLPITSDTPGIKLKLNSEINGETETVLPVYWQE